MHMVACMYMYMHMPMYVHAKCQSTQQISQVSRYLCYSSEYGGPILCCREPNIQHLVQPSWPQHSGVNDVCMHSTVRTLTYRHACNGAV